jgi:MtrB/PioB family decaheme-associated outer membrane protein
VNIHWTIRRLRLHASVLAVNCALGLIATAHAQADPAFIAQTQPKNVVEVGAGTTSGFSAKANEYNGLNRKGPFVIGNFELRGGGAYDSQDATRWRVIGSDLGLESRSVDAEYGLQGRYRIRFGYDELLRNQSDSYQTPYLGVGSNVLTLPPGWVVPTVPRLSATTANARGLSPDVTASNGIIGGVSTPPTASQAAAAAAMQAADLPSFRSVNLSTKRTSYGLGWEQVIDANWALSASASREHKDGLKALGAQSRATGADTSSILPTPIDQDDDKLNLGVSYTSDSLQLRAAYESSFFKNNVPSVTWNLWAAPQTTATMATAPSNMFHKLLVSGNYDITPTTRVAGNASYSRNTQNVAFLSDTTALLVPASSAQAEVVTESVGLKVFHRASKELNLSAGYKYDLRDNRTPVNVYGYYDNNNASTGTSPFAYLFPALAGLGQNFNLNANTPYSKRVNQINLDANYKIRSGHQVKVGWDASNTDRYCTGSWIDCADATKSTENTLRADWNGNLTPNLSARIGAATSHRAVDYNENAFLAVVPMAGQVPSTAVGPAAGSTAYSTLLALGLTGYGPTLGLTPASPANSLLGFYFPLNNVLNNFVYGNENRISELIGMRRYNQADRNRDKIRASADWQATEALALQGGFEFSHDDYSKSVYGLQNATNLALNLDGTYAASDTFTVSAFASFEDRRTRVASNSYTANSAATTVNGATAISGGCFATIALRNANNKIDPCLDWSSDTRDRTTTLGASFSKTKLLTGKLDIFGSVTYSEGRTDINVNGGSYVNNPFAGVAGAPSRDIAAYFVPAVALPTNRIQAIDLRLGGTYHLSSESSVRLVYGFQHLRSSDWGNEGFQDGNLTQVLPTREQTPHYAVHSIGASYQVRF